MFIATDRPSDTAPLGAECASLLKELVKIKIDREL